MSPPRSLGAVFWAFESAGQPPRTRILRRCVCAEQLRRLDGVLSKGVLSQRILSQGVGNQRVLNNNVLNDIVLDNQHVQQLGRRSTAAHRTAHRVLSSAIAPGNVMLRVPSFIAGAIVAAETDGVATLPTNLARRLAEPLGLVSFETPIAVPRIEDPEYVPALRALCDEHGVRAVVPLTDLDLEVLGQARADGRLPAVESGASAKPYEASTKRRRPERQRRRRCST